MCPYDTIREMVLRTALILALGCVPALWAQLPPADEPIVVNTEHPRLLMPAARLRLLKRERERKSPRWIAFENFLAGRAAMPESGFAKALYFKISGEKAAGDEAIAWALGTGTDLRQQAIIFDWCQDLMSDAQRDQLAARMQKGIADLESNSAISAVRARVMAAVALFDHVQKIPRQELESIVRTWWAGKILPEIEAGRNPFAREDAYALYEMLHALRDSTNIDLRESARTYFRAFPTEHLVSYYPAPYPAPENPYYIGAMRRTGDPDLRAAALSRAAELAMVAYDTNAPDTQLLQGWLMHDKYSLRGAFGVPYEFLWANPYQPGLSYNHTPQVVHNEEFGRLFIRSSWEDTADWFGLFDGVMQSFRNGRVTALDPAKPPAAPLQLDAAAVCFAKASRQCKVTLDSGKQVFFVGLEPKHTYLVEVDDEEMFEVDSDPSGILEVEVPPGREIGVRIK